MMVRSDQKGVPSPHKSARANIGANGNRSFADSVSLNIAKMNFESSQKKSTYAINNPHLPPLVSPIHERATRLGEILDQVIDSNVFNDNLDAANAS